MVKRLALKALLLLSILSIGLVAPIACSKAPAISITLATDNGAAGILASQVADPTVKIEAGYGDLGTANGSGVLISSDIVITAYHVIEPYIAPDGKKTEPAVFVLKEGGRSLFISSARPVAVDLTNDLAAVRLETPSDRFAALKSPFNAFPLFTRVLASGYPVGCNSATVTEGRIQQFNDGKDNKTRFSYLGWYGNSGGPIFIFSDGKWRLYSIAQQVYVDGIPVPWMSLGVKTEILYSFIEGLR